MQKIIKSLLILILTIFPILSKADNQQEITSEVESMQEDNTINKDEVSLNQEELLDYLSNSISFEKEKNRLINELEIAKLKSEISKIEKENANIENNNSNQVYNEDITYENNAEIRTVKSENKRPKIIIFSEVAGMSKFGVLIDNRVKFFDLNKEFKDNSGNRYIINKRNNNYVISNR